MKHICIQPRAGAGMYARSLSRVVTFGELWFQFPFMSPTQESAVIDVAMMYYAATAGLPVDDIRIYEVEYDDMLRGGYSLLPLYRYRSGIWSRNPLRKEETP